MATFEVNTYEQSKVETRSVINQVIPLHLGFKHDLAEFKYSTNTLGIDLSS